MKDLNKSNQSNSSFKLQELLEESLYTFRLKDEYKNVTLHLIDDLVKT
jgi:hypothetical protein